MVWKFSARGHGKGVPDGIGGTIKSLVRRRVLSKDRSLKRVVVTDAKSFAELADTLSSTINVIYVPEDCIRAYAKAEAFFANVPVVDGISVAHVMQVNNGECQLWR